MKKIELLSPAGNFASLKAAVHAGANSVYIGAKNLNARMGADNFTDEEIPLAIKYAKFRNVKVYITLNTLLYNNEIKNAASLVNSLYNMGADAIIVQDLGLVSLIIENSKINIHASTQMSCNNLSSVKILERIGFSRIVLAREMNIKDIEYIHKNSSIELETFAHGALCVSFSGQCLYSFFRGGRSGNRGQCAQPCRMEYNGKYILSTKDLMTIDILPEIIESGVTSLKIEGRSKRAEYVEVATRIYRQAIDLIYENKSLPLEKYKEELIKIYNRGGFTKGYYLDKADIFGNDRPNHYGQYIGEVEYYKDNKIYIKTDKVINVYDGLSFGISGMEISDLYQDNIRVESGTGNLSFSSILKDVKRGDKVYRTTDKKQIDKANAVISSDNIKHKLNVICEVDKSIKITAKNNTLFAEYTHEYNIEEARTSETTKEDIISSISKTGSTVFVFENIEVVIKGRPFIPVKILNESRRAIIDILEKSLLKNDEKIYDKSILSESINYPDINIKVLFTDKIDMDASGYNYKIFMPNVYDENIKEYFLNKYIDGIILPHITFDSDIEHIKNFVCKNMIVVCNNIGQIEALKDKAIVWAGIGLNALNDKSVDMLYKIGCSMVISSLEAKEKLPHTIALKSGFVPVMNFVTCPKSVYVSCGKCKETDIYDKNKNAVIFHCVKMKNTTSFILEKMYNKNGNIDTRIKV